MNTKLLLRVKRAILRHPKQFDMSRWFFYVGADVPRCGTTACIAGWALTLDGKTTPLKMAKRLYKKLTGGELREGGAMGGIYNNDIESRAAKALGLTEHQARWLFHVHNWPREFQNGVNPSPELAAQRIDHFIATEGRE